MTEQDPLIAPAESRFPISLERLLFGAIAFNLLGLIYVVIFVALVVTVVINVIAVDRGILPSHLFVIDVTICCAVYPFVKFCIWAARGFLEAKPVPIITVGVFFTIYGITFILSGNTDGYVAIGTVILTVLVITYSHWDKIRKHGLRLR